MTTHYNIKIVATTTEIKATYRDGKFRKLEHLRGKLDQNLLNSLGRVVPKNEIDFEKFINQFKDRVAYTNLSANKVVSIYSQFNSAWHQFFRKENNNISPKFTGADGNALKQIINYLKSINNGDEAAALSNWQLLLDNWSSLSDFHQKQTDLKYINSKLNVIIREIIKSNSTSIEGTDRSVSI